MMASERNGSVLARIAVVARKEIVDIFRDRRTMLVTLVTAIVAGPVLMLLVLNLVARQADKARAHLDAATNENERKSPSPLKAAGVAVAKPGGFAAGAETRKPGRA